MIQRQLNGFRMPRYFFTALAPDGSKVSDSVVADADPAALELISRRGLVPLSLSRSEQGTGLPWWQRKISLSGGSRVLSASAQEQFVSMLAALLEAKLPLMRALAFCAENARDAVSRRAFGATRDSVENGMTLADAMAASRPGFEPDLMAVVRSGEASNQLPALLRRAAQTMAARARIRREVRGALVYPSLLLALSVVILLMIAFYLAPTLLPVFASSGVTPPFVLKALAGLGQTLRDGWLVWSLGAVAVAMGLWLGRAQLRAAWRRLALRLPGIGPHLKRQETLRLASSIGLMLSSGAPLVNAVTAAREATSDPQFVALLDEAEHAITAGGSLAPVLAQSGLIDPMSMTLIAAGEEADQLAQTLTAVAAMLETRISQGIAQAIRLITPLLTLGLGLGVGSIILATVSAIMDMNDLAI